MSNIVEITDAVKTFRRGSEEVRALDGISLGIAQGDFLAVVGPSGSGKTTLLNMVGCVDKPSSGTVSVHGMETEDLTDRTLATIRSTTMGFVFQQFFLMPTLTAIENVIVPGRFCAKHSGNDLESRARQLLGLVGLADRADHLPRELSGGEMQRVALARAMINEPEILLADEPTGNLDTGSAEDIAAIFDELNGLGLTIVVVTHNLELAANATRSVHLKGGRIVEEQQLRPVPVRLGEPGSAPGPVALPDYMPAVTKKRTWGSPAVALLIGMLGAVMCAVAFMPFITGATGIGLMNRGAFATTFYRGNDLTRVYFGAPATLLTGMWPIMLGVLLIVSGGLFLLNRQRLAGWSAVVIGSLGAVIAVVNILMVSTRLGPDSSMGFAGISTGYGLWVLLGTALAAVAVGVPVVIRHRRRRPSPGGTGQDL